MQRQVFLSLILFCLFGFELNAQYLAPAFQNKTVSMRLVHSGLFVRSTNPPSQQGERPNFSEQQWVLEPVPGKVNWYWIKEAGTNMYIRVHVPTEGQSLLMDDTEPGMEAEVWEFQFIAQPEFGRYKIHSRYNQGGVSLVLEVDPAATGPALLRLGKNKSVGNEQHQKFDLTDLYPPVDPGTATPSLANRFENRTVGFKSRYYGSEVKGDNASGNITLLSGFPAFDTEFKLEYTNETGWYKIRHKPSGKYISIENPVDGGTVRLRFDAEFDDDRQKFKFIVQAINDYTYKVHSKYSVGTAALLLEMSPTSSTAPMRIKKNIQVGSDQWQQFEIYNYLPAEAEFSGGVPTNGSGKILGKQYYISNYESLALLEPYVVGSDTFLRVQPNPVYGEQSEWTFDDGVDTAGFKHFRIRYGKTGQYLYLPVATQNTFPAVGTKLKLVSDRDSIIDLRYHFRFDRDNNIDNTFALVCGIAPNGGINNRDVIINDDGNLVTDANTTSTYKKNRRFFINLSLPTSATAVYSIVSKAKGHPISDSGRVKENTPLVHARMVDLSCLWNFLPTGDGYYRIRNTLTNNYVTGTANGTSIGSKVGTTMFDLNTDAVKWEIIRSGNYYKIKNKSTGHFLSIYNHPEPGNPIYNTLSTDAGTLWAITRSDYIIDPAVDPLSSSTLLSNYSFSSNNILAQDSLKNKLMRNLGLPFQPTYAYSGISTAERDALVTLYEIPYQPPPNFYLVVRSALAWRYNWSQLQVDSAMRNYKFTIPGHRVQVVYALRSYILEVLGPVNRLNWSYDERELVAYLERAIKRLKENYATRLEDSWGEFKQATYDMALINFNAILLWIPDPDDYSEPDYYIPASAADEVSLVEYAAISRHRNYRNPGQLATYLAPAFSVAGATVAANLISRFSGAAHNIFMRINPGYTLEAIEEAAKSAMLGTVRTVSQTAASAFGARAALNMIRVMGTVGGAAVVGLTVASAIQTIVQQVQDGVAYENFDEQMTAKINRLRTHNIKVDEIMGADNLLNKLYLAMDIDYVLGTGERFDELGDLSTIATFSGNGNWSDPANWTNGRKPNLSWTGFTARPDSIIINPQDGGQCIVDEDVNAAEPVTNGQLTLSPSVPIVVQPGKTLRVKAGKMLRVGNLTIKQ